MRSRVTNTISLAFFLVATMSALAADRVHLVPKFSPGQRIRYRIESSSKSTGKTTAPIVNPEGGTQSSDSIHMMVRLEVLNVSPDGGLRLRATYERSAAESEADALDLSAESFSSRYNRLDGRTFEFTLEAGAKLSNVQDLTAATAGQSSKAIDPALAWLQNVTPGETLPKNGISIGQKWRRDRPVEGAVLSGLTWRGESTYLRNEACGSSSAPSPDSKPASEKSGAGADLGSGVCAVILTRFEMARQGSAHSDATPEDYRRNGLHTSGTWTGSGESLDEYSLGTGLLVSATQSETQNMDYQVTSGSSGSSLHHVGKVQSQSQITLVPVQP
jgi:hypothetical protein